MIKHRIRSYFFAGLIVWLPILATFLVLHFIVGVMDSTLSLLPYAYQPKQLFGISTPGLGVLLSIVVLFVTGLLVTNYLGGRVILFGEALVERIPLVRSIYKAVKQIMQTVLSSGGDSFRNVLLVEYPRAGLWSIGFQTTQAPNLIQQHVAGTLVSVFIPTTPNPMSGFLILVPKESAILLEMSVEDAIKWIISLGAVQ